MLFCCCGLLLCWWVLGWGFFPFIFACTFPPIFACFPVVFCSARAPAPQCTLPHPYAPSHTHINPYLPYPQKHDVRGIFPGHVGTKSCPAQPFMFLLALFLCAPVPLHPTAPIQTRPRPFPTIYTRPYPKFHHIYV